MYTSFSSISSALFIKPGKARRIVKPIEAKMRREE
jgi:hypothetical protein